MEKKTKFLVKNISFFTLGELGTKLISFFLVPLYTYILTTSEYGNIDLIITIGTVLTPLIMLNIGEAIMRYLLDDNADHNKIMSIGVVIFIFGTLFSFAIIPIFSCFKILENYKWYMFFYIVLCSTKSILIGYLKGSNKLNHYVICNILNTFLIVVFNIIFLVFLSMGIKGYLLAYILAETFAVIYAIIFGKISITKFKFDKHLAKSMIAFSLAVVPNSLLWWVINSSDRIMVTSIKGLSENGLLAVSYKIPSILIVMNTILMQAWKYSAIKENNNKDNEKFTNIMFDKFIRMSILISAILILVIKFLFKLLFSSAYYISWSASLYLILGFVFMGISTFVGTIYYVKKDMIGNMLSAFLGALINIILNAILIPVMGFSGAALSALIAYLSILLYRYYDTKKYQKINLFCKDYIYMFILLIFMITGNLLNNLYGNIILVLGFLFIILINHNFICSIKGAFLKIVNKKIVK